ncbi:MAG: DUF5906 domain-containing protein [Pseudomonadota bacterium]
MTQEIAKKTIELGMKPIPVPHKEKSPKIKGWPDLNVSNDNLDQHFPKAKPSNVAVLMGSVSGNIVDVDLDHPDAQYFASNFLPTTGFKYGRESSPNSHAFYKIVNGECKTLKMATKEHGCLIEIRGNKAASMFPGSIHPSGEIYKFSEEEEIGEVSYKDLQQAVNLVAVCVIAALEWPEKGSRNDAALALSGLLCKAGYTRDQVVLAVYLVAKHANDDGAGERRQTAEATWKKYEAGQVISGYNAVSECFGENIAKVFGKWLKQDQDSEIDAVVDKLNQKYAFVKMGGKVKILEEVLDPYTGCCTQKFHDVFAFKQFYLNQTVIVGYDSKGPIYKTYAQVWLTNKRRRTYEAVIFKPSSEPTPPEYFNTWQGFSVKPDSSKDCSLFQSHVENIVCSGDKDIAHWVFSWMADAVQNTCEKPGTALVLIGKRGTGKSFFGEYFGSLFDPHRSTVSQASHVTGKFNSHFTDIVVLQCEEAFWAGDKAGEGVLKDIITNDTINIERKGVDVEKQRNFIRMLITSNESWVVPAGMHERRFLVLHADDEQMQNEAYFNALADEMNNGGREALLHFLQNYNYEGVNLRKPPRTKALMEQMIEGLDPLGKFLYLCLERGAIYPECSDWPEFIPTKTFREIYKDTISDIGLKDKSMATAVGTCLRKYFGHKCIKKRMTLPPVDATTGESFNDNMHPKSLQAVYILPSLDDARQMFSEITGVEFTVSDEITDTQGDCNHDLGTDDNL